MSTLHGAKRIGVILLGALWVLLGGIYAGFIRPIVFVLGGFGVMMCAFLWVLGVVFDVPDARNFGPWFFWSWGATVLILLLGDLLFQRDSK